MFLLNYNNFLLRGEIWNLFLTMWPKSKYLLKLSHLYQQYGSYLPKWKIFNAYFEHKQLPKREDTESIINSCKLFCIWNAAQQKGKLGEILFIGAFLFACTPWSDIPKYYSIIYWIFKEYLLKILIHKNNKFLSELFFSKIIICTDSRVGSRAFLHIIIWSSLLNFLLYIVAIKVEFLNALISFVKVSIFTVYQTVQTKGSRSLSLSFDLKRCRNLLKNKVKAAELNNEWIKVNGWY